MSNTIPGFFLIRCSVFASVRNFCYSLRLKTLFLCLAISYPVHAQNEGKTLQELNLPAQASDTARANRAKRGFGAINEAMDRSDITFDGRIDSRDLRLFSERYLKQKVGNVEWCVFHANVMDGTQTYKPVYFFLKHFPQMLEYIYYDYFCEGEPLPPPPPPPDPLELVNTPKFLARIAMSKNFTGDFYVTDPVVGSVFIYDSDSNLKQELKGLAKPLGLAVDMNGYILVGNDGRDNVEIYDPADGRLINSFGDGFIEMPNAIIMGPNQRIYVVDSIKNTVHVYDDYYNRIGSIGSSGSGADSLNFPADAVVITTDNGTSIVDEIYVADQVNKRIQVYDLNGNHQGSILPPPSGCSFWAKILGLCDEPAPFARIQGLYLDIQNRLHVVDMFTAKVSIIDPLSHDYISSYGSYGTDAGQLRLPLDMTQNMNGESLVTDPGNNKIEIYAIP